jgi:SAM-dependent methyltransferase
MDDTKTHWESVYKSKSESEVSWTQADPQPSLSLIQEACSSGRIIDVGGGTSVLVDRLLGHGYSVSVLDISSSAIERAKARLGGRAESVQWIVADVAGNPEIGAVDVWHDRAVFHFLTSAADRAAYVTLLGKTVVSGGHAIIATFALDGPEKCSGLPVQRYDGPSLETQLGTGFIRTKTVNEIHKTPWGKPQSFQYSVFRRV